MWKDLLVEVFVPTQSRDVGVRATGYPVGPDRVLTARHVMFPETRDSSEPIVVRWYHQAGPAGGWQPIERIAWDGGDHFDAALIACAFPEGLSGYGLLSSERPTDGLSWASEGFARAGRKDAGPPQPVPMLGQVHSAATCQTTFHLGVDYGVKIEQGWKGASGSPVFVGNRILGVVVSCPDNFDQARLEATPTWMLLEDDEFRREIGYDTRRDRLAAIVDKVATALRGKSAAMNALDEDGRTSTFGPNDRPDALAELILDLSIDQVLSRAKRAYRALVESDQPDAAAAVRDVANLVVPAVFDDGVIEGVRLRKTDVGIAIFPFPAATRTVAEIIMAGVDRRRASFKPSSAGEEWPEGTFALPMPPEQGRKDWSDKLTAGFHGHLVEKFVDDKDRGRTPNALVQHVANRLKRAAEEDQQTWYCVFEIPDDGPTRAGYEAVFRNLKACYPSIVFIELTRDDNVWVRETDRFDPLRYLLLSASRPL